MSQQLSGNPAQVFTPQSPHLFPGLLVAKSGLNVLVCQFAEIGYDADTEVGYWVGMGYLIINQNAQARVNTALVGFIHITLNSKGLGITIKLYLPFFSDFFQ